MPSHRLMVAAVTGAVVLAGCSPKADERAAPAPPAGQTQSEQPIGLSPGGVTTRVDVPAASTEEQYAQSCMAAKEWMSAKGGDPHDLVEPYLKEVQTTNSAGPETFRKTWAELSAAQQAAVIIAVQAAADGGC